ncbi:MAG: lytic murein transglycosylase [Pseudomonadota bacterium]
MNLNRRAALAGGLVLLAGCVPGGGSAPVATRTALQAVPNAGWDAWVAGFKGRAAARGFDAALIDRAFRGAGYLPGVIERDRNQTEFRRSLEDYLAIAASDERVSQGRANARRFTGTLGQIESRYGVPANVVTAIWGLESFYGARRGDIPVMSALSTLAYDGRRGAFFEDQLIAALRILQNGDTTPERMVGSWAGAMGHTQFIPTSYLAFAADFDGDGRRDIWADDPTDALASAARYLEQNGWRNGQPWGLEVQLPAGFSGPFGTRRSVSAWNAAGLRDTAGRPVPDVGAATLLRPDGRGPAFLVFANFGVILRYNNAESYAIGVGHLSDRIAGAGPLQTPFGPDRFGLTIDERKELQRRLTRAGFDTEGADGVIGPRTEAAIRGYQQAQGLSATGQPSPELLARLR